MKGACMKLAQICCLLVSLAPVAIGQGLPPKAGYVPDSKTAIRIAEAVLAPIYGEEKINAERPFNAELKHGTWTVTGTLHCPDEHGGTTTDCAGGTAEVKIAKSDGRVLFMIHYK
jgi:hypothetical protein